jgi:hypothetical protein
LKSCRGVVVLGIISGINFYKKRERRRRKGLAERSREKKKTRRIRSNNSKVRHRHSSGKETATSTFATSYGLRSFARETSSKGKMIPNPSPSSTRKSECLEKRTLTPTFKRKSQRIEKKGMPSLLRRSDRGKKLFGLTSSGAKKSNKSLSSSGMMLKKEIKEKSVKQLILETKEVGKSEREDESLPLEKMLMDARAYRALFKKQPKKVIAAAGK